MIYENQWFGSLPIEIMKLEHLGHVFELRIHFSWSQEKERYGVMADIDYKNRSTQWEKWKIGNITSLDWVLSNRDHQGLAIHNGAHTGPVSITRKRCQVSDSDQSNSFAQMSKDANTFNSNISSKEPVSCKQWRSDTRK